MQTRFKQCLSHRGSGIICYPLTKPSVF